MTKVNKLQTTIQEDWSILDFPDTPETWGAVGQALVVNADQDGLEWATLGGGGGPLTFTALTDTPANFTGHALKYVRVNAGESLLEFVTPPTIPTTIGGLSDVDSVAGVPTGRVLASNGASAATWQDVSGLVGNLSITTLLEVPNALGISGQVLAVNGNEDALEWVTPATGGGVSTFVALTDTPSSMAGQAGRYVRVNGTGTALEFVSPSSVVSWLDLNDTPSTYSGAANRHVVVNTAGNAIVFGKTGEPLVVQVGLAETTVTTGTARGVIRIPRENFVIQEVRASLKTASSSGNVLIDVNLNGSTILAGSQIQIDQGQRTSTTSVVPVDMSLVPTNDDDEITIDVDSAGTGAQGLVVYLIPA